MDYEPKHCPIGCGQTLTTKKITKQEILDVLPNDTDLDNVYGILCNSCGYATIIGPKKK